MIDNKHLQFFITGYSENSVARPKHETAILDKRASFECSVKSPNAAEVEIWWQFQNQNVTTQISDSHKVVFDYGRITIYIIFFTTKSFF